MSFQLWRLVFRVASLSLVCGSVPAQANPSDAPWSGQVVCQLNLQSDGYMRQETQTWTMAGGTPRVQGAFHLSSVIWTATGSGSVQRTQNGQAFTAQWTLNPASVNGTFAVFVRASDNRLIFRPWHTQLRADLALRGMRQSGGNGSQQPASSMAYPTYEWQLPWMDADPTSSNASGSFSVTAEPLTAELANPPSVSRIANCTWQFIGGATAAPAGSVNNSGINNSGNSLGNNTQTPVQTPPSLTNSGCLRSSGDIIQSFTSMKVDVERQFDRLIQEATDPATKQSLQTQKQKTLADLATQEQKDLQSTGSGCASTANSGTQTGSTQNPGGSSSNSNTGNIGTTNGTPTPVNTTQNTNPANTNTSGTNVNPVAVGTANPTASIPSTVSAYNPVSGTAVPLNTAAKLQTPQMKATQAQLTQAAPATAAASQQNFAVTLTGTGTHFTKNVSVATFSSPQAVMAALSKAADSYRQITQTTNVAAGGGSVGSNAGSDPTSDPGAVGNNSGGAAAAGDGANTIGSSTGGGSAANPGAAGNVAPSLQVTRLDVLSNTSAVAYLNIDPAAFGPYQITMTTGAEVAQMSNGFSVAAAPKAASGNYLVTIIGLVCNRALTHSDAAYASAFIAQYDRSSGNVKMFTNAETWVYGDVNGMQSTRKQAGDRSPTGGIGNGNVIPNGFLPGVNVTLPPQANLFPMKVWQGPLTDGVDAVLISPNVWEDYGGDRSLLNTMMSNQASMMNSTLLDSAVQNQINSKAFGPLSLGPSANAAGNYLLSMTSGVAQAAAGASIAPIISGGLLPPFWLLTNFGGPKKDRPIGLVDGSTDPSPATIVPDTTLVLTREIIEKKLGGGSWAVVPFDFKDTARSLTGLFGADTQGEYTMYIEIQRQ